MSWIMNLAGSMELIQIFFFIFLLIFFQQFSFNTKLIKELSFMILSSMFFTGLSRSHHWIIDLVWFLLKLNDKKLSCLVPMIFFNNSPMWWLEQTQVIFFKIILFLISSSLFYLLGIKIFFFIFLSMQLLVFN